MKKLTVLITLTILLFLSACSNDASPEEYDTSDLQECFTDIITEQDSDACSVSDQTNYIQAYLEELLRDYGYTTATIEIDFIDYIVHEDGDYLTFGLILDDVPVPSDVDVEDVTKNVLQAIDQTLSEVSTLPIQSGVRIIYNNDVSYRLNRTIEDTLVYTTQVRSTNDITTVYDVQESTLELLRDETEFDVARLILSTSDMIAEIRLNLVDKTYTTTVQIMTDSESSPTEEDFNSWVATTLGSTYQVSE